MMFKIKCKAYRIVFLNQLEEHRLEFEPQYLNGEDGFVNAVEIKARALLVTKNGIINAWAEHNRTMVPDISVNVDDMLAIELIKEG